MPPLTALKIDVDNPWFRSQKVTLAAGQQLNVSVGVSTFVIIRTATVVTAGDILLGVDNQEADTPTYDGFRYSTPRITFGDGTQGPSYFERVSLKNTNATSTSIVTFYYGVGEIDDLAATVSGTMTTEERPASADISSVSRITAAYATTSIHTPVLVPFPHTQLIVIEVGGVIVLVITINTGVAYTATPTLVGTTHTLGCTPTPTATQFFAALAHLLNQLAGVSAVADGATKVTITADAAAVSTYDILATGSAITNGHFATTAVVGSIYDATPPAGTLYTIITNLGGTGMLATGGTSAANENIWISTEGTRPAPTAHNQLPAGDDHDAVLIPPNYGSAVVNGTQVIKFDATGSTDRIALIQFVTRT